MNTRGWLAGCVLTALAGGGLVITSVRPVGAAPGGITMLAGGGRIDGTAAGEAAVEQPFDVAADSSTSNVWVLAPRTLDGLIGISPAGRVTQPACGVGSRYAVAADSTGIYVADAPNLVRLDPTTCATTRVAGNGFANGLTTSPDGPALSTALGNPTGLTTDAAGRVFMAEPGAERVRVVAAGAVTTVAGTGYRGFSGDGGPANLAQLDDPHDIARDAAGNLFIADTGNHRVRKVDTAGTISTIAGSGAATTTGDGGPAAAAGVSSPVAVAVDGAGNVFVTTSDHRVRRIDAAGTITTVAGNGTAGFSGDGAAGNIAQLNQPAGLAIDATGAVLIADRGNNRVRRVAPDGTIGTYAGNGLTRYAVNNGPASAAWMRSAVAVAVDRDGSVLVGDSGAVRRIDTGGNITLIAGVPGTTTSSGDGGPATSATFDVADLEVDLAGQIYIADRSGNRVRRIGPDGTITTVAGDGTATTTGDGAAATTAGVRSPGALALDPSGVLYIGQSNGYIRRVGTDGVIATVAGTGVAGGASGDGGPATAAAVDPRGLAIDAAGRLFIANWYTVRMIDANGIISTVAGSASAGGTVPHDVAAVVPASSVLLNAASIAFDGAGTLWIAGGELLALSPTGTLRFTAGNCDEADVPGPGASAASTCTGAIRDVAVEADGDVLITSAPDILSAPGQALPGYLFRVDAVATADVRTYVPATPTPQRLIDTRSGIGLPARLAADTVVTFPISGVAGVANDAAAVMVNLTVDRPGAGGWLRVYPCEAQLPSTSNVNFDAGETVANTAITRIGTAGTICFSSSVDTDLIVDLQGWYPAHTDLHANDPVRIADSRTAYGFPARLSANTVHVVRVAGVAGLPSAMSSAALNLTVDQPAALGWLRAYPCGGAEPPSSNVNFDAGETTANLALSAVAADGTVCVYSTVDLDLIVDVMAWYPTGASYRALQPVRVADSRNDLAFDGIVAPGVEHAVPVDAVVAAGPGEVVNVALNVTVDGSVAPGWLRVYPCGRPQPASSNLNFAHGEVTANFALVELGTNDEICIETFVSTHVIIDVQGWHRNG